MIMNISRQKIGDFIDLINDGLFQTDKPKKTFEDYMKSNESAKDFIEKRGLIQVSDIDEIE